MQKNNFKKDFFEGENPFKKNQKIVKKKEDKELDALKEKINYEKDMLRQHREVKQKKEQSKRDKFDKWGWNEDYE